MLVSPNEVAVLNVLRREPWRWWTLDNVWRAAPAYHPVPRRTVRHHLARFGTIGLVETTDDLDDHSGSFWRWRADANPAAVLVVERAARAEGLILEPLAAAPTHCPQGHAYADHGHRVPDGYLGCLECAGATRYAESG
jgi:hypothetical protein